jgi:hypothetical protein
MPEATPPDWSPPKANPEDTTMDGAMGMLLRSPRQFGRPFWCRALRTGLLPRVALFAAATLSAGPVSAFVVDISPGRKSLYLQVGSGSFSGLYAAGGTPQSDPVVNLVSVTVPSAALLSGADQQMSSDSSQAISFYDGRVFCAPPDQVYIGAFFRRQGRPPHSAVLSVTAPPALVSATGDAMPFSQIRWTSSSPESGIGDGVFVAGGTQFLADFFRNSWRESCLTFFYRNEPAASGTYEGRVTYTLTAP